MIVDIVLIIDYIVVIMVDIVVIMIDIVVIILTYPPVAWIVFTSFLVFYVTTVNMLHQLVLITIHLPTLSPPAHHSLLSSLVLHAHLGLLLPGREGGEGGGGGGEGRMIMNRVHQWV